MHVYLNQVIKGCGDEILPTNNPVGIWQYSDIMLKYLPKDSIKTLKKTLLYSKRDPLSWKLDFQDSLNNNVKAALKTDENSKRI